MKSKVLIVSEFSDLSTGYAVYTNELLKRLHTKYECAELASYVSDDDPRVYNKPWKVFPVMPSRQNQELMSEISKDQSNAFGKWRFEETLLKFKPTHVISIRDKWFDEWIDLSPYRSMFNWAWLATVDAPSQHPEWMDLYSRCDGVLTYNDWSRDTLEAETNNRVKVFGVASPATPEEFKPLNKELIKQQLGLSGKYILGTVMRNQKRKLFPDLFKSFRQFLDETGRDDILLYCHTSYPDMGWDLAALLLKHGISSRTLFTYLCSGVNQQGQKNCGYWEPRFFSDGVAICPKCNRPTLSMSNVKNGLNNEQLCVVYNLFDLYVQYSTCFVPGTKIYTDLGWKNIEDITNGENVLSHNSRFQSVTNTFNKEIDETIVKITVNSDYESIKCTKEHPFYAITDHNRGKYTLRCKLGDKLRLKKPIQEPEFIEADKLFIGDMLAYKIDMTINDVENIDLASYIKTSIYEKNCDHFNDDEIIIAHGKTWPRYIQIDEEFCRFIGLFAADGTTSDSTSIKITCNKDEQKNIDLAYTIFNRNCPDRVTLREYKDRHAVDVICSNNTLRRYLQIHCKSGYEKQLPDFVMSLPINKQKTVLYGLFMGDGCVSTRRNNTTSIYETTSRKLADQLKHILRRLKINFNCNMKDRSNEADGKKRSSEYFRFEINGDLKNEDYINRKVTNTRNFYYDDWHFLQIKNIEEVEYSGLVYNLEVNNDNSYLTKLGIAHNCEGQGMPPVEAAACGVPVMETDFSAMADVVRKLGGEPIKVLTTYHEMETGRDMSIPNFQDFVEKLKKFFNRPKQLIVMDGNKARTAAEKNYGWDNTVKTWIDYVESVDLTPYETCWSKAPNIIHEPPFKQGMTNRSFIKYLLANTFPFLLNSYIELKMVRNLNYGIIQNHMSVNLMDETSWFGRNNSVKFSQEDCYNYFMNMVRNHNKWESIRNNNG